MPDTDPPDTPDSTAPLVRRIQAGDPKAEEELVHRFSAGLRLMLRRLTRDPGLAEDLHQETFRAVLEKVRAGEIQDPEKLSAYLRGTARNLLSTEIRREARSRVDGDGVSWTDPDRAERPAEAPQLQRVLRREEARLVRNLLGEMRFERDRQVLTHFYLSDRTKQEVCQDLGIDPNGFKKILFRARERLRDLWERAQKQEIYGERLS